LTLSIRPIRLKRSVYFRVPNDIVDLISLEDDSKVTLALEEKNDRHLLVYSVIKKLPENSTDLEIRHSDRSPQSKPEV